MKDDVRDDMNHEKEHKQEALGEYKITHPSLHRSITVYASIMLYNNNYICPQPTYAIKGLTLE